MTTFNGGERVRFVNYDRLLRIAKEALMGGYGEWLSLNKLHMRLDMDCEEPVRFSLYNRGIIRDGVRMAPLHVSATTRCRKCFSCQRRRSKMWAARAITEYQTWPRTVFGTFTMSPFEHEQVDNRARLLLAERQVDFDCAADAEKFTARARVFGHEVTAWLKRVRQGHDGITRTMLRYLLVAEVHDSDQTSEIMRGRPHYHMLLHEMVAGSAIKGSPLEAIEDGRSGEWERRMVPTKYGTAGTKTLRPAAFVTDEGLLRRSWNFGHTKFQFCEDPKSAYYVCKYLSKAMHVRVRASVHYGDEPWLATLVSQRLKEARVCLDPQTPKQNDRTEGE